MATVTLTYSNLSFVLVLGGAFIYIELWTIVIVAVASKCPASNGDWVIGGSLSSTHVVVTSRETAQYKFARAHTRDFWLYRSDTVYIDYRGPTIARCFINITLLFRRLRSCDSESDPP